MTRARSTLLAAVLLTLVAGLPTTARPASDGDLLRCVEQAAGDPAALAACGQDPDRALPTSLAADDACASVGRVSDSCPAWVATYGEANNTGNGVPGYAPDDQLTASLLAAAGDRLFVAGRTTDPGSTDQATVVLAYDPQSGTKLWERRYDLAGPDVPLGLTETADGSRLFVTMTSRRPGSPSADDAVALALDPATGETQGEWRWHGGAGNSKPAGVHQSADGTRLYLAATTHAGAAAATSDYAVVAWDLEEDEQLWDVRYDGGQDQMDALARMIPSPDGGTLYLTGQSKSGTATSDFDIATVAIDAETGARRWARRIDGGEQSIDAGNHLGISPDGSRLFVGGIFGKPGIGPSALGPSALLISDYAVLGIDTADGSLAWSSRYRGPSPPIGGLNVPMDLVVDDRGQQIFLTGLSSGEVEYDLDIATVALRAGDGAQVWGARYATPAHNYEYGASIVYEPEQDRVYVAGSSATIAFTQFGIGRQGRYVSLAHDAGSGARMWTARYGTHADEPARILDFDAAQTAEIDVERRRLYVGGTLGRRTHAPVNEENYHFDFGTLAYALPGPGTAMLDAGGFRAHNLEFVGHIPTNNDSAGARIVGDHLYITTSQHLKIYDISDAVDPQLVGVLAIPAEEVPYLGEEDVDTNGKILLFGRKVVDVSNKANPVLRPGNLPANPHTWSCVLDCTWAYGSEGQIVNLANHTALAGSWTTGKPATNNRHDVTEVAPGIVVTSSNPFLLLDANASPANPTLIARGPTESRFNHGNLWPNQGTDRFLLVGGESGASTNCSSNASAVLRAFDVGRWVEDGTITQTGSYTVRNGLFTDGDAPVDLFCAHWFDTHPTYRNGGLVAMAWYEHGTRLLRVTGEGKIREVGYYVPYGGSTSAAYWVTDDILYSVDYNRGLDILRYTGRP